MQTVFFELTLSKKLSRNTNTLASVSSGQSHIFLSESTGKVDFYTVWEI